jgi:hypothetical protein
MEDTILNGDHLEYVVFFHVGFNKKQWWNIATFGCIVNIMYKNNNRTKMTETILENIHNTITIK